MFLTGVANSRGVIPFARTPGNGSLDLVGGTSYTSPKLSETGIRVTRPSELTKVHECGSTRSACGR